MDSTDKKSMDALLQAATPILEITSVVRENWCRVMSNENDSRIGPWKYTANFEVINMTAWGTSGEVIYFVTDVQGRIRLVGQSMSKLKGRWKQVPMYNVENKELLNRRALFHTSSWPAIEAAFERDDVPPFYLSAIFRDDLNKICLSASGGLKNTLLKPETHLHRLSYHVETWVCSLDHGDMPLWNIDKVAI